MNIAFSEYALIEQQASALFGGDPLLPNLISGEVEVAALEIETGKKAA